MINLIDDTIDKAILRDESISISSRYIDVMINLIEDTIDKAILRDESISIPSCKELM